MTPNNYKLGSFIDEYKIKYKAIKTLDTNLEEYYHCCKSTLMHLHCDQGLFLYEKKRGHFLWHNVNERDSYICIDRDVFFCRRFYAMNWHSFHMMICELN